MSDYTNYPVTGFVYKSVYNLLDANPHLMNEPNKEKNALIYIVNWPYGFGSALIVYLQNIIFLRTINEDIVALPHYSKNTENFKYHDESTANSFFHYFNYKQTVDVTKKKIYFCNAMVLDDFPKFTFTIPIQNTVMNKQIVNAFTNTFSFKLNDKVKKYMDFIRQTGKELIGIHIRSLHQKRCENPVYMNISFETRLSKLKNIIMQKHENAVLFIATDVEIYLYKMKELFGKVEYLNYIERIYNEQDSIPQLDKYKGHKLGRDIIDDCYALSLCDKIYISNSNIPFMVTLMNKDICMEEY
jgi:hypothetical protein